MLDLTDHPQTGQDGIILGKLIFFLSSLGIKDNYPGEKELHFWLVIMSEQVADPSFNCKLQHLRGREERSLNVSQCKRGTTSLSSHI